MVNEQDFQALEARVKALEGAIHTIVACVSNQGGQISANELALNGVMLSLAGLQPLTEHVRQQLEVGYTLALHGENEPYLLALEGRKQTIETVMAEIDAVTKG
jgi:hypothetical protein